MKTQYKNVYLVKKNGMPYYQSSILINGKSFTQLHKTERDAALSIDRTLISQGREPVNILKRKVAGEE